MDSTGFTRRRVIGSLGAAGMIGLAGCGGDGGDGTDGGGDGGDGDGGDGGTGGTTTTGGASGTVRIGAFNPHSGALAYYGNHTLWSMYSGLKYKGGESTEVPGPDAGTGNYEIEVGDVTYQIVVGDSQGSSSTAQTRAEEFVSDFDIDVLLGGTSSASAQTVASNVASPEQVPYMVAPAAAVSITGSSETCGPNIFRAAENVAMDAQSGGAYVANETDIESVWIYYADYSFGQDVDTNYTRVLEANGVSIDGHTALPQGYSEDWGGQLDKARDAGSDAIIAGFTVATLPAMFSVFLNNLDRYQFSAVGGLTTNAGATAIGSTLQSALGDLTQEKIEQAGLGPFTTRYHWNQYDNEINTSFVDFYTDTYGIYPDLFSAGGFVSTAAIHEAVQAGGSTNQDDIRENLTGLTVSETPKGQDAYTFQEYNNQARSPMTVAPMIPTQDDVQDLWGDAPVQPGEPVQTYGKDQTTPGPDSEVITCDL
jgi:branched-chain amino acid transport system substrate-binding protein